MLPILFSIGPINIFSFGVLLAAGFFIGAFIIWRRLKDLGLPEEKVLDALILSSIGGLISSKLVFAAENFPQGGFSFWGGLGGFFLVWWWFSKKEKWDFWLIVDEITFGVLPFSVLVQIGSFLDGANPGKPTTMPWGIYFPGTLVRSQPISLFFALALFLIWVLLLKIERHWRTWDWFKSPNPGFIFLSFLGLALLISLLLVFWSNVGLYWLWIKVSVGLAGTIAIGVIFFYRSGRVYGKEKKS
jgi:phosphatidylglycerol:prolipoprotein diacylglycerol transferase